MNAMNIHQSAAHLVLDHAVNDRTPVNPQPTVLNRNPLLRRLFDNARIATPKADDYELARLLAHEAYVTAELNAEAQPTTCEFHDVCGCRETE
jgi:hypothetical protein